MCERSGAFSLYEPTIEAKASTPIPFRLLETVAVQVAWKSQQIALEGIAD